MKKKKVLFVCTGNSCRSVIAEALFKKLLDETAKSSPADKDMLSRIEADSAGVAALSGMNPPPGTLKVMVEEGIDVSSHVARSVDSELIRSSSLIIVMEKRHEKEIVGIAPESVGKIFLLKQFSDCPEGEVPDIADPIGQSLDFYRQCAAEVKKGLGGLLEKILSGKLKM